jgi:hypothetical protein
VSHGFRRNEDPVRIAVLNQLQLLSCKHSTAFRRKRKQQTLQDALGKCQRTQWQTLRPTQPLQYWPDSFVLHASCATSSKHPIAANVS